MTPKDRLTRLVCVLCFAIVALAFVNVVRAGDDHGCHHDCGGPSTTYNYTSKENQAAEVVVAAVVGGCVLIPAWQAWAWPAIKGLFTWSRPKFGEFHLCGIDDKKTATTTSREDDYVTPPSIDVNVRK